ncbi:MAG TPA: hypothetical protein P5210_16070 [Draconibacterium sp.]|nr:hypothetical protein [Draconibacterium sp.]
MLQVRRKTYKDGSTINKDANILNKGGSTINKDTDILNKDMTFPKIT